MSLEERLEDPSPYLYFKHLFMTSSVCNHTSGEGLYFPGMSFGFLQQNNGETFNMQDEACLVLRSSLIILSSLWTETPCLQLQVIGRSEAL